MGAVQMVFEPTEAYFLLAQTELSALGHGTNPHHPFDQLTNTPWNMLATQGYFATERDPQ